MGSTVMVDESLVIRPESDRLYEVIDGQRVEKPVGAYEISLANVIQRWLAPFADEHGLGRVVIEMPFEFPVIDRQRLPDQLKDRVKLLHGALTYRDARLEGFDAAAVVEVIEHLDPPRLGAFARVLFGCARPGTVVLTTPNREYNVRFEGLPAGKFRHADHRFE